MIIDFPDDPYLAEIFVDVDSGRSWIWDGQKWVTYAPFIPLESDQIADNSIIDSKFRDSNGFSVIGRSASFPGDPADIIATTQDHVLTRSATALEFGLVQEGGIAEGAITTGKIANSAVTGDKIAASTITGDKLAAGAVPSSVPAGAVSMYAGNSASPPSGWLYCKGQAVSRTTYAALFTAIGQSYGSGDGVSTFNVPNLDSKFPVGLGSSSWSNAIGETGGNASAVLLSHTHDISHGHSIAHGHTGSTSGGGEHNHNMRFLTTGASGGNNHYGRPSESQFAIGSFENRLATFGDGTHSHGVAINPSGDSSGAASPKTSSAPTNAVSDTGIQNLPPYITLNFIIKT